MRDQTFQVGQYQVYYSVIRIGYLVVRKNPGVTADIMALFWHGDDRGFAAAKVEAERLHDADMVEQLERQQVQQAGNV